MTGHGTRGQARPADAPVVAPGDTPRGGEVRVDGVQELRKTAKIRAGQTVELDGVRIRVVAG